MTRPSGPKLPPVWQARIEFPFAEMSYRFRLSANSSLHESCGCAASMRYILKHNCLDTEKIEHYKFATTDADGCFKLK